MDFYNRGRTHAGQHDFGKTPWQTWLDGTALADAKQLDWARLTVDPPAIAA
jgi:hypothetical protein